MTGIILLSVSTFLAFLQVSLPLSSKIRASVWGCQLIESVTALTAFLIGTAFFYLIYVYITSDFSFLNVAFNSHQATALIYKIAGVWGNHEGSMLLWLFLLTLVATFFGVSKKNDRALRIKTLQILGLISLSFHLFILLTSNPFVQLQQVPIQGRGLNPLLEDPALAFHPPILYTGLALLSVIFSYTCAALQTYTLNKSWAQSIRPWVLVSWCFITFGIALGSWWAYYELGWGGWWFWDPVENISLLPWLTLTALIHSLIMVEKRNLQVRSSAFLAMVSFLLALTGLFLVRSGVLTSVHAFALDTLRGWFLGTIALLFAFLLSWYFLKYRPPKGISLTYTISRETLILFNVLLFSTITGIVLLGTVFPLILEQITHQKISIGAPYFNATLAPFLTFLVLFIAVTPFINWQKTHPPTFFEQAGYVLTLGLATFVLVWYWRNGWTIFACLALSAAICALASTLLDFINRARQLSALPLKYYAMSLAHVSIAIVVIGATIDSFEKQEYVQVMKIGETINLQGYHLTLEAVDLIQAPYFQQEQATVKVKYGPSSFTLLPEKRYYPLHEVITTETAIKSLGLSDLYAVLGSYQGNSQWTTKFFWHPAIQLIWIGAGLMIISGLLAAIATMRSHKNK